MQITIFLIFSNSLKFWQFSSEIGKYYLISIMYPKYSMVLEYQCNTPFCSLWLPNPLSLHIFYHRKWKYKNRCHLQLSPLGFTAIVNFVRNTTKCILEIISCYPMTCNLYSNPQTYWAFKVIRSSLQFFKYRQKTMTDVTSYVFIPHAYQHDKKYTITKSILYFGK